MAEIGGILVQVQEDLQQLKQKLREISHDWDPGADAQSLEAAIEKAESGLKKHAEQYLNAANRSVLTISRSASEDLCSRQISKWGIPLETSQKEITFPEVPANTAATTWHARLPPHVSAGSKHKFSMALKILCDPRNPCHRSFLNENYGVTMPLINRRKTYIAPTWKIAKGVTVGSLSIAPPSFPLEKVCTVFPVSETDSERGILNLIERGLIPRAARITLEKPLVLPRPVPLHEFHTKYRKTAADGGADSKKAEEEPYPHERPAHISTYTKEGKGKGSIAPPPSCISVIPPKKSREQLIQAIQKREPGTYSAFLPKTPGVTPAQAFQSPVLEFNIPVRKGTIDYASSELQRFKRHCCLFWGSILSILEQVASLLNDYAVPFAIIKGKKVMEVISDFELNQRPTREELLSVLKNASAVRKLLSRPGQRYKGHNGTEVAAIKIQATWRCYKLRKAYIQFRRHQWASGVIAISWMVHIHMRRVRKMLKDSRQRHLKNFYIRAKHLAANWNRIRTSRRTIIHIPSLGYAQSVREATPDFAIHQGSQIGRLCEIQDPNVDVIYVCPFEMSEEMLQYYNKLLGLQTAVRSGNPEDMADLQDRFKILTPEAIQSFPDRPMSLATFLKYSPRTIKRIKHLIQGKEAYVVGGLLGQDDLDVADALDVPILGPDPEVAHLYTSKSGSKRIFAAAEVPVPPGRYDIYSRQQLVEVLSQLIIDYPEVKRWVFKVDDDFGGSGTAFCDIIANLRCHPWILKESRRYGPEIWRRSWAHEPALAKISQELPGLLAQHAQAVNEKRFPTWGKFLQTFVRQGGVIEAFPPSDSITNITVDMLIDPTGEITVVSCGDQFHANGPFRSSGTTVPQSSVEPQVLNSLCFKIGEACKSRGVVGYFSIDFVTFIHPQTLGQQVWAIDLDLHYSDHLASTQLLLYLTNGTLDCSLSRFQVQVIPPKPKSRHARKEAPQPGPIVSRCVIMSTSIMHANLSIIYYSVFLQMCKSHGIGYDLQLREGSIFTPFEDRKRHRFGMLTIGEHLQGVLMTFAQHLFIIYQELSAPNMHAETNFKEAVQDVERILGVAEQNKLKFEKEEEEEEKATKTETPPK
ncbi:IQ domain-containing protein H isoform X2 [Sceloporus undulatus]|uniref:IQ domain-containing protein H isoform X2 n=1 Tax=Sceloporus undulatus TaxID=8520 RepID=UPI001C4BCC77|nr:IQ domain-containing protein H isoform X2 [Sceloporus undulatus]